MFKRYLPKVTGIKKKQSNKQAKTRQRKTFGHKTLLDI